MSDKPARKYSVSAFTLQLLVGMAVGSALTGVIGGWAISLSSRPMLPGLHACNCAPEIEHALGMLLKLMGLGAAGMAVLLPLGIYLIFYHKKKVGSPVPGPGATTPPPATP